MSALETSQAELNIAFDHQSEPTARESLYALATENLYFNIALVIFLPLGFLSDLLHWGDIPTFFLNMIAIVALAKMLDLATDQLSHKLGQTLGALVNASFGNAVELIVGIMALREGLTTVVQASLLGSVLSNLLLVLGFCFFLGGLKFQTQKFSLGSANINASMLGLTMVMFLLPTALKFTLPDTEETQKKLLLFSRGSAFGLLAIYVAFLIFQLKTHKYIFISGEDEEELEETIVSFPIAAGALVVTTVLIGFSAEFLVGSIDGISTKLGISQTFIGLIVLPVSGFVLNSQIVGNAAEHVTAVFASLRNKQDLAIGVALGSSLQISILVTPLLVLIGWIINVPLTISFPVLCLSL
jgi:Ca2+:H+ antiporter